MGLIGQRSGRRRLLLLALIAVFAAGLVWGLAAALADSGSPAPSNGNVALRVGWASEPNTLNPFRQSLISEFEITHLNYDYLVGVDAATYQPKPELATSWSSSPDGLTWTFKIRQGVKWQDGQPFTASDVAFTYNYIIKNNLTNFTLFTGGIKNVTAPNPTIAVFHLLKPWALMLRMYVPIVPEHIWSKVPAAKAESTFQNANPVGTGPFKVTSFTAGQNVVMTANKNYWRGAPKIDEIVFDSYQNPNSMAEELKSGAIDAAGDIPDAQFMQLQHTPGFTAIAGLQKGFEELGMNCYNPPPGGKSLGNPVLRDWKFRQALNWAVDKTAILNTAYLGYGAVATSVIQPGYFQAPNDYHWQPPANQMYTFNLAKAGQMLTAAGYPLKNGVRVNKQGKPITLRLVARANSAESQRAGKLLTSWFTQLGLKISYQVLDESALIAKQYNFSGKTYDPDYDLFLWDWVGSGSDPNYILGVFTTAQIANFSDCQYSNQTYDKLFAQQETTPDPTQRKAIIWHMQQILYKQSPYVLLVYARDLMAYNSAKWTGWVPSPANGGGVFYGADNIDSYLYVHPVGTAVNGASANSSNTGLIAIVVIIVVVLIGVGTVVFMRRRSRQVEQ
jgi:peptide/nickel transport system substrate-binding protein